MNILMFSQPMLSVMEVKSHTKPLLRQQSIQHPPKLQPKALLLRIANPIETLIQRRKRTAD